MLLLNPDIILGYASMQPGGLFSVSFSLGVTADVLLLLIYTESSGLDATRDTARSC